MIVKVLADSGQSCLHVDAQFFQIIRRADAGQEQKVGGADGAGADDDFARCARGMELAAALINNALATALLDRETIAVRSSLHRQVTPVMCGLEKRHSRAAALAVARRRCVGVAHPHQLRAGKIVVDRMTGLHGGVDERIGQRVWRGVARNRQRSASAMITRGAAVIVLRFLEVGQDALVVPSGVAQVGPMVVVRARAAHIDHSVETARSAQYLAPRPVEGPIERGGLRRRRVSPIERSGPQLPCTMGRRNPLVVVDAAGLQQQNVDRRIFGQACGDRAAG